METIELLHFNLLMKVKINYFYYKLINIFIFINKKKIINLLIINLYVYIN